MINIAVIFGTRPEVIKMAPIVKELKKHKHIFNTIAIATSQHRDMIKYPIKLFDIKVDHDLDIMREKQDLFDISTNLLESIKGVYSEAKPGYGFGSRGHHNYLYMCPGGILFENTCSPCRGRVEDT